MALGEMVPWKWGGLRRWGRDDRSLDGFRREIQSMHRELDRLFEGMIGDGIGSSLLPDAWSREEMLAQMDVTEDEKAFHVSVDLPGQDEKDVEVTLADRLLTIRGEKKEEKEVKEKDYCRRERASGRFRRSIEIPADVDAAKIEASFKKGVLTIQLPKTKEAQQKVKQITVKAA